MQAALLREARRLLDARGPAALSLREVARAAGVSQAAPYRHFDGKEGLLAALAADGFRELERRSLEASASQSDPLARLYAVGEGYVLFAAENAQVYRLMFGSVRKRRDPAVAEAGDRAFAALVEVVRVCQQAGEIKGTEPGLVAATVTTLCHGIASFFLDGRTPDGISIEGFTRVALEQMVEGVGSGSASKRS